MPNSNVFRVLGPTVALSVINTPHAPTQYPALPANHHLQYASFLNTGATVVAVNISPPGTAPTPLPFPADGAAPQPVPQFILPPLQLIPLVVSVPSGGFTINAISNSSVSSTVFVYATGSV